MAVVKVLIGEIDGAELDEPSEHLLLASEVPVDSPVSFPLSATDLLAAISEAIHAGIHDVPAGKVVTIAAGKTSRPCGLDLKGGVDIQGCLVI